MVTTGFRIEAIGAGGFRHESAPRRRGTRIDAPALLALLRRCARHERASTGGSALMPCIEAAHVRGSLCLPALRLGIGALAARRDARYGHVFVTAGRTGLFTHDVQASLHYGFPPGEDAALGIVERLVPALERTRLDTVGVLRELAAVFNEYALHPDPAPRPVLRIVLWR